MAEALADRLGLDVELGIIQSDKVGRTDTGADHRLAFNPTFEGDVKQGQKYLVVDDTLTMGGQSPLCGAMWRIGGARLLLLP